MTDQTFGKNRRSILLLITAGLVLMLVSTLSYFCLLYTSKRGLG